jgi:hypothetical protein
MEPKKLKLILNIYAKNSFFKYIKIRIILNKAEAKKILKK